MKTQQTYKPAEIKAVIEVLQKNTYHCFSETEAHAIVIMLYKRGFKIIHTGSH
jgi:urate oxidase